ncbi:MAG: hypothetical protein FWG26_09430 [Betaproteobacteria bacterium]|nr:hypothetical protein [Betaproteobacteria bacterium]
MATRPSKLLLSVAISFTFCATSFAQDTGKTHNFNIAPEVSSYEYKEPGLMKISGTMVGFSFEYLNNGGVGQIKESMPVQLRARLNYMRGELDYEGGYLEPPHDPVKMKAGTNSFVDMVFAGGFESKLGENFSVAPYLGLGYRYLEDSGGIRTNKVDGYLVYDYKREQTYYYLPIGADWKMPLGSGWKLAINTELDVLLRGENTSDGIDFRQKSGYGTRLSIKVEKNLQSVGIFAEPFYRYWNISASNVKYGLHEPKNRTNEYGLRVGVSF